MTNDPTSPGQLAAKRCRVAGQIIANEIFGRQVSENFCFAIRNFHILMTTTLNADRRELKPVQICVIVFTIALCAAFSLVIFVQSSRVLGAILFVTSVGSVLACAVALRQPVGSSKTGTTHRTGWNRVEEAATSEPVASVSPDELRFVQASLSLSMEPEVDSAPFSPPPYEMVAGTCYLPPPYKLTL
ncbi:hypothetical protein AAVH_09309 [Aphelenchoides avenae]|nr:hypothetical protein AAVH_09309 [Aphelenchus avenae]